MDWNLDAYFPSLDSAAFRDFKTRLAADLQAALRGARSLPILSGASAEAWEKLVLVYEDARVRFTHSSSYVGALASVDGRNSRYRRAEAEVGSLSAALTKLDAQLVRGLGAATPDAFAAFVGRPALHDATHFLERARARARFAMAPELEELAADLGTDGLDAWGRLYDMLTSTLSYEMTYPDGRREHLPISARRSLMCHADRRIRRGAFEAGNLAFEPLLAALAAALNHIAGARLSLYKHRNIGDFLEPALFDGAITQATLNAMWEGVERQRGLLRQLLTAKANTLGLDKLSWFDLHAPVSEAGATRIDWAAALAMIRDAFHPAYPELCHFFDRAVGAGWIEWQPRDGKRPGAYCTSSPLIDESRIFLTYQGMLSDVVTLAHETGHAFHNHLLRGRRGLARAYPMTLAESASTFAELLLRDKLAESVRLTEAQRQSLFGSTVDAALTFLLDIRVRFEFEKAFYEERRSGEVSVERLNELMVRKQLAVFDGLLDDRGVDPYFWASKLHFFITKVSFYNYPYTFGYLLSRGFYAEFKRKGPRFLTDYETFLQASGSLSAPELARKILGCDLEQPDFWERSVLSLSHTLTRFQQGARRNRSG